MAANPSGSEILGCQGLCADGEIHLGDYCEATEGTFDDLIETWSSAGLPRSRNLRLRGADGTSLRFRGEGVRIVDPGHEDRLVLLHLVPLDERARTGPAGRSPAVSGSAAREATQGPGGGTSRQAVPRTPPPATDGDEPHRPVGKMEAMANLSAGIAHDFNNLLTVMKVELELALEHLDLPAHVVDSLLSAHAATRRAESLVSRLLAFSRRQLVRPTELDLNALLDQALPKVAPLVKDLQLVVERAPSVLPCRLDFKLMQTVLLALVENAVDASEEGSSLTIRTRRETLGAAFTRAHDGSREGDFCVLEVEDQGTGISPEVSARMFEPFFTTKSRGHGHGLGLAETYGIVKMLGGYLKVDSLVGTGSTFTVYLPRQGAAGRA